MGNSLKHAVSLPPDPRDHNGWHGAVAENRHHEYDAQVLFCALQGLGAKAEVGVRNALADLLSRLVIKELRRKVSPYHPNEGWDIIYRTHETVFAAAANPNSKDGAGFREAFHARLNFRLKDAIATEVRLRRTEEDILAERAGKAKKKAFAQRDESAEELTEDEEDYLSLSRAERYTTQNAGASKFLDKVRLPTVSFSGSGKSIAPPLLKSPQARSEAYPERELALYMDCPARYRYEVVERLRGGRDETPYVRFHRCVYVTVSWLESERQAGRKADVATGLERLQVEWSARGPVGHGFEAYYRAAAHQMVCAMSATIAGEVGTYDRQEWKVTLGTSSVSVTPDRVLIAPEGVVRVQRNRTGKKTKSEVDRPLYALLRRGAQQRYPGKRISVETFYLATGDVVIVQPGNEEKRLQKYLEAMAAIEGGEFPTTPEQRKCPSCPCYFTCGS